MNKLIKKLSLGLIIILLLSCVMVGCGGNGGNENVISKDKILLMATSNSPVIDWDPSICFSTESLVMANFYETLIRYDSATDSFIPVLATEYEKSEDGLVWTFKIREGVHFHDGNLMDADAVVYSLERSKNINKGASFIWDPVDTIVALNESTVEIRLSYNAPLDQIISCSYSAYIMSPEQAEKGTDWFQEGNECGTGPYVIHSQIPGDEVIMSKFDDYWQGWEGNRFETIIVRLVGENASRRQMLESGEADVAHGLMVEDVQELKKNPNLVVYEADSLVNVIGYYNTHSKPFDDKRVRQAINYVFPYDDVVNYVAQNYKKRATGPIPTAMWGALDKPMYEYNPEKAKALLTEAGYPDGGFDMRVGYVSSGEFDKKTAELFTAELMKLNINVKLTGMAWDQLWEKAKSANPDNQVDWLMFAWWPDIISPASWYKSLYMTEEEPFFNLSRFASAEFDDMILEADVLSGIDRDAAEEIYLEAAKIISEEAVSTFIVDDKFIYEHAASIKNFSADPAYPYVLFFYDFYRE